MKNPNGPTSANRMTVDAVESVVSCTWLYGQRSRMSM
jgi:hypothetical protein